MDGLSDTDHEGLAWQRIRTNTILISHEVQPVIPAQAGIQSVAALDTGLRRCDGLKGPTKWRISRLAEFGG
jgi:hypothetical protein